MSRPNAFEELSQVMEALLQSIAAGGGCDSTGNTLVISFDAGFCEKNAAVGQRFELDLSYGAANYRLSLTRCNKPRRHLPEVTKYLRNTIDEPERPPHPFDVYYD